MSYRSAAGGVASGHRCDTQRGVGSAIVTELRAAGFDEAVEIGHGGFGAVYRCIQVALGRLVAVKVLTSSACEDRSRFLREQLAMGRLTGHPNIVGVLQVGETESHNFYFVMQYYQEGSLQARIRRDGKLPLEEVLRLGVKIAGAVESAHRTGILHRDVKPANILLSEYGEPALTDFGIARIAGGFKTVAGTFTGSPAFTAPEILAGDTPTPAADIYGLGATLFCALTGHAPFERRSGEQIFAQLLRIAREPVPDLCVSGIPEDVAELVGMSMSRDRRSRPSALALGQKLQELQARRGLPVDDIPVKGAHRPATNRRIAPIVADRTGNLPVELSSFIGRRAELAQLSKLMSRSRLVTVTGIGGVGKTRLALRAATEAIRDFPDGVRLVDLGELQEDSDLPHTVGATLGLCEGTDRPDCDVLINYLSRRKMLLVVDNCEHVVDSAAKLVYMLLRACPRLHILVTSREALDVSGEVVFTLAPLPFPSEREPLLEESPTYDAVMLFTDRAASALPGFTLTDNNKATVADICSRLEGLPLAIELAAAYVTVMSPQQILQRLCDRYTLLNRGSRSAPTRQQTLASCVRWSYDLCTPAEQILWCRLAVFAGAFELQAAEDICSDCDLAQENVADLVSSLVHKSILIRTDSRGTTQFRMLDTLRDYGTTRVQQSHNSRELRLRYMRWYRRLLNQAFSEWFTPRQVYWLERIEHEAANVLEAVEFGLTDEPDTALGIVASMVPVFIARGNLSAGRSWLDRVLTAALPRPTMDRIWGLYGAVVLAGMQNDVSAQAARLAEARPIVEEIATPLADGLLAFSEGLAALVRGDFVSAGALFESALRFSDEPMVAVPAMAAMGWALQFRGEINRGLLWQEKALNVTASAGEFVYRSNILWSLGVGWWKHGEPDRAEQLLRECLQLSQRLDDKRNIACCLEVLAWTAGARGDSRRAVKLLAAAQAAGHQTGALTAVFPHLLSLHEDCEHHAHQQLTDEEFESARAEGNVLSLTDSVNFALCS